MSYLKDNPEQLKTIEDKLYSIILPDDSEVSKNDDKDKDNKKNKKVEENVWIW